MREEVTYVTFSLSNERRGYICNIFSYWLRPCQDINRKETQLCLFLFTVLPFVDVIWNASIYILIVYLLVTLFIQYVIYLFWNILIACNGRIIHHIGIYWIVIKNLMLADGKCYK